MVELDLRMDTKRHVFVRDWSTCSKFVNHSRLIGQHNGGGEGGTSWSFYGCDTFDFENHSSNRGAQKFPYVVAKTHITFVHPRVILTLTSRL